MNGESLGLGIGVESGKVFYVRCSYYVLFHKNFGAMTPRPSFSTAQ
jgi:hypothetical protein